MALATSLAIRWVHVLAMAVLLGGAVVTWGTFRTTEEPPPGAAETYEWLFWLAAGLVVMTGVGNLGSLAPFVPGPNTSWGLTFALKLVAVVGLLVGSVVRTLAVLRGAGAERPSAGRRLGESYAATSGYLFVLVALAVVLAHG